MIRLFRIDGIEAKRFIEPENAPHEIRIDNNSTILSISYQDEKKVKISFKFTITYSGIGMIALDGMLIYEGNAREIAEEWKKKHRMPDKVAQEVHATIINNCIIEAVWIAKEVRLPPPIPPPAQFMQQKISKKKGDVVGYA
ncbi:MAG TPA: hypothetical protein ENL31_01610 [Candidatus Aciduliprofundum boonei]|uniref:Uncharacterized protein n=1 Tax=Candidatus Aciduliprofundum boonei TaxID=379547 RepID=A0A7J3T9A7_9ARCH|nr:hypothetical protein [Candidatus Aciduliprofundum boonei]